MSNQPQPGTGPQPGPQPGPPPGDSPQPDSRPAPDPTAPPVSGQPWPTPSGDPLSAEPFPPAPAAFAPGYAPLPQPPQQPQYPPTSQFPPVQPPPGEGPVQGQGTVNYAPPGYTPDYGAQNYSAADYAGGGGYQQPGYQQPGYQQPGYQQPGYPPPGYPPPGYAPPGYDPAGPPPRKSNTPLVAVIVAVALLLCAGVITSGFLVAHNVKSKADKVLGSTDRPTVVPTFPTVIPDLPGIPSDDSGGNGQTAQSINVTYEVTGDGPAQILYIKNLGETPTRVENVKLPWTFTTKMDTPAVLSVIALRTDTSKGQVTCRALVNGAQVKEATSGSGPFSTAACTYFAFN